MKYYANQKLRDEIIKKTCKGIIFKKDTVEKREKEKIQITDKDIVISYIPDRNGQFSNAENVKCVISLNSIKNIADNKSKYRYEIVCNCITTAFDKCNNKTEDISQDITMYIYKYFDEIEEFEKELKKASGQKIENK